MTPQPPQALYRIDAEAGVVYLLSGLLPDFMIWRALVDAILADPAYRPGMNLLSDRRDVATFSNEYAHGIASFLKREGHRLGRCRWAVVAATPAVYGMTRLIEANAEGSPVIVRAFNGMENAEQWVRRDDPMGRG